MQFSKMHGLGNDFMVVDAVTQNVFFSPELIRRLADRHLGVGFDQLLVVEPPYDPELDFHYRIFNADGSEVAQCGNGARCFARFVRLKGLTNKRDIRVSTANGRMVLTVTDDDLASGCDRVKSVKICTVQMLQCILSASRIKSITICQERHSALLLTKICDYLCIVRTKECHISKLSEMHLDGYEFSIHIDIFDSCGNAEFFQFVQLAGSHRTTKISEINC